MAAPITHFETPVCVWFGDGEIERTYLCSGRFYPCDINFMSVEAEIDAVAFEEIKTSDDYQEDFIYWLEDNLGIKIDPTKFTLTAKN